MPASPPEAYPANSATPLRRPILPCALAFILSAAQCTPGGAFAQQRSGNRPASDCQLQPGGESTVVAVAGPQTLQLADGRFVRLTEILVPEPVPAGFDPSVAAAAYLRQAALGRKVEVKFGGTQRDRYGVYLGHIYVAGEPSIWLQEGLVRSGFATVVPQANNHACTRQLLASEAAARQAKSGHWGLAYFKVLKASDPRSILNLVQTYQIVEGTVQRASESGGRITLHFGAENRFGFTVNIEPAVKERFAGKQTPENWAKLSVRLRGWIEKRRGPVMSVSLQEQIELMSQNPAAPNRAAEAVR